MTVMYTCNNYLILLGLQPKGFLVLSFSMVIVNYSTLLGLKLTESLVSFSIDIGSTRLSPFSMVIVH